MSLYEFGWYDGFGVIVILHHFRGKFCGEIYRTGAVSEVLVLRKLLSIWVKPKMFRLVTQLFTGSDWIKKLLMKDSFSYEGHAIFIHYLLTLKPTSGE